MPAPVANVVNVLPAIEGVQDGLFRITLSEPSSTWITVSFSFSGTATPNVDFFTTFVGMIAPGDTSADVVIDVTGSPMDDSDAEGAETVTMTLNSGLGYTVGPNGSSTMLLFDNDGAPPPPPLPPPVVTVETILHAAEGVQNGVFRLFRTDTTGELFVNFSLSGTAISGTDYAPSASGAAYFAPNQAASDVIIVVRDAAYSEDGLEGTESIVLTALSGIGYTVSTKNAANMFLADNTAPAPVPITYLLVTTLEDDLDPTNDAVKFSLREAIHEVNKATGASKYDITFAQNILGGTITLGPIKGELVIKPTAGVPVRVIIDGSGMKMNIERDSTAAQLHRLFSNAAGTKLTLINLNLFNGLDVGGGAIYSAGDLTIQNCYLSENRSRGNGGAIAFDGGTLVISNSEIRHNRAEYGGGISIGPSVQFVSIVNTDIWSNRADLAGGAMAIWGSATQNATLVSLSGVTVDDNRARMFGAGIWVNQFATGLGVDMALADNTVISDNHFLGIHPADPQYGGGIYFGRGTLRASNVTIRDNTAKLGDGMYRLKDWTNLIGTPTYVAPNSEYLA